jgi:hypothetical protein
LRCGAIIGARVDSEDIERRIVLEPIDQADDGRVGVLHAPRDTGFFAAVVRRGLGLVAFRQVLLGIGTRQVRERLEGVGAWVL